MEINGRGRSAGRPAVGVLAAAVVLALAACGGAGNDIGSGGGARENGRGGNEAAAATSEATASPAATSASDLEAQYEKAVQTVLPSVVQITTDAGEGSGVVYDTEGDVVTNAHVVAGAHKIQVTSAGGGRPLDARPVGQFAPDDIAVVKVNGGGTLRPARFGDSTKLRIGQMVLAMGNPLGLSGSVTQGIVSQLNREVSTRREGAFPGATIGDAIQTSAAINPGNSGGALVTLNGEVIGIPTAAASDPQMGGAAVGIGFATPSGTVQRIAPQLIKDGKVTNSGRAALGVVVRTIIDPNSLRQTAVGVVSVTRGSGAEKAGIVAGDLILAVNGSPTPSQPDLAAILAKLKPGDKAKVEVQKADGSKKTVEVVLGQLPGS
ncbi:PDZ domain-containing protein [Actinomadura logoneensis]|uniref:PDZ domain-containing protein n=1 Tax=Actinomadura logoneensis TaxID=2293572 RepID=A0A372JAE4_9ACTN|nr:trypsin-like peptidase domain-containing protein [Actinomadura logoneensis]RFU36784.1 PDZ domain-containing protein [Actinomadura logoneensis]